LPTKQVSIPFHNEAILSSTHSGLSFNYDMDDQQNKKIVCKLSNNYKSWFEFQGVVTESGFLVEITTLYLSKIAIKV
jgi:hypothetical protein